MTRHPHDEESSLALRGSRPLGGSPHFDRAEPPSLPAHTQGANHSPPLPPEIVVSTAATHATVRDRRPQPSVIASLCCEPPEMLGSFPHMGTTS
jgi:hypothetical protein